MPPYSVNSLLFHFKMFKFVVHFEIFSMLWRPSEMKNVPPRITQRDKLTLSIQILAQTLADIRQ